MALANTSNISDHEYTNPRHQRALLQCLMANQDALINYIAKSVEQRADAEDLFQKMLLKAMKPAQQAPLDNPLAYGYRMAQHLVIDYHREQRRAPVCMEHEPESEAISLDTYLDHQQRVALYQQVLADMSPLRREIFVRRRLHNESRQHIAHTLGLNEETVKKHITRAMDTLKLAMESHFSEYDCPRPAV